MRLTSRAISVCVTALAAMAILVPVQTAQAAPRSAPITATPPTIGVALTDDEARTAGYSLTQPTTVHLATGGTVIVTPGDITTNFMTKRRWFGIVVFFNEAETYNISLGAGACSIVVGVVPTIGTVLVAYCAALSLYAGKLDHDHKCLRATVFWGSVAPLWTSHNGRYCR
jgi:hypothetical protein